MQVNLNIANEIFYSFPHAKSLKSNVHFTLRAQHNSDTKFSLEILDLYLDCIKLTVEKVGLHAQWLQMHLHALE